MSKEYVIRVHAQTHTGLYSAMERNEMLAEAKLVKLENIKLNEVRHRKITSHSFI